MSARAPRAAVTACAALTLLASVGGCAAADGKPPARLRLTVPQVFYLRPPGATHGPADSRPFRVSADRDPETAAGRRPGDTPWGRLTLDARELKGVARLQQRGSRCTGGAAKLTCPVGAGGDDRADRYGLKPVAAAHSRIGDSGVLRYRLVTAGGATRTAVTRSSSENRCSN